MSFWYRYRTARSWGKPIFWSIRYARFYPVGRAGLMRRAESDSSASQ